MQLPDIDPSSTWVVSDTHFGHDNIVRFCHRPTDHEQVMLDAWRDEVPEGATVIHLGDLCYRSNARFKYEIAPLLTGARMYLIKGNHDKQRSTFYRDCGFCLIKRPFEIDYDGVRVTFSHYPLTEPNPFPPWSVHLHGHIHNNGYGDKDKPYVPFAAGQINLSVEQTKYRPVNLKRLLDGYLEGKVQ